MKKAGWLTSTLMGTSALLSSGASAQENASTAGYANQVASILEESCDNVADETCLSGIVDAVELVTKDYLSYAETNGILPNEDFKFCENYIQTSKDEIGGDLSRLRANVMDAFVGCVYLIQKPAQPSVVNFEPEAIEVLENHLACLRGYDTQGRETCPADKRIERQFNL